MKISSCSSAFASAFGSSVCGKCLMDWIPGAQQRLFKSWVEYKVKSANAEHGLLADFSQTTSFRSLKFQSASVEHAFDCTVVGVSGQVGRNNVFTAELVLTNVNKPKRHRALAMTMSRLSSHEKARPCRLNSTPDDMSTSSEEATDRDDSFMLETSSCSSSDEKASCCSSRYRSAHQDPNAQHSDARLANCGESSSLLEAVIDLRRCQ